MRVCVYDTKKKKERKKTINQSLISKQQTQCFEGNPSFVPITYVPHVGPRSVGVLRGKCGEGSRVELNTEEVP